MAVHVAVLLSGSFRTLLDCNGTLVQQLHRANPNVHFHTFLALTINKESDRPLAEQAAVESYPCVAAVKVDADSDVTEAVRREMPDVDSLPKGRGTARGKALNIIKMFRGIWTASRLMRGKVPHNPMQLGCIPLPKNKPRYLPWWSSELAWAFDQLAFGSHESMMAYSSGYRTTLKRMVNHRQELYPEAAMWEHLASIGGEARMRHLHGFHATLARPRPSGSPFHDDPFGKLRIDAARTSVFIPHAPSNACIASVSSTSHRIGAKKDMALLSFAMSQ